MKRPLFLFITLLVMSTSLSAQYIITKIGGGLAKNYGTSRSVGAFKLGAGYEYETGGNWSLEAGLYYYGKGYKDKDETVVLVDDAGNIVVDADGNPRTGKKNRTVSAHYLSLPLLAHYYMEVQPHKYIVLSFGPYVSCGVGGKDKVRGDASLEGYKRYYSDRSTFSVSGTHRLDVGGQIGIGYQWNQQMTAGVEADLGVLKFRDKNKRNLSALLTFAYRFRTD